MFNIHSSSTPELSAADTTNTTQRPSCLSNSTSNSEHDHGHEVFLANSTNTTTQIPSSSSSSSYDAFLSFWGDDSHKSFTSHLYEALVQKGIHTFWHDNKLKKGTSIGPELLNAIEQSTFAVIVFSKNYAGSKWCLDELVHIVECKEQMGRGPKAFPVFYHVKPSEVRNQTGDFGEAFARLEEDFKDNIDEVNKWRKALKEVGSLSGWDLKNRSESEVTQEIAIEISKTLDKSSFSLNKGLIGMRSRIEELMKSYLALSVVDDARTIGIWGMGGIGKTTLAEEVYKVISHQFEASAFIADVREKSRKVNGLVDLQKDLHTSLLEYDAKIPIADMGIEILSRKLNNKKVLIILDDVDDLRQIEALAADQNRLGPGSRVIITTRNEHLLIAFGVPKDNIYELKKLNDDEAFQLFCQKAFKKDSAPDDYIELSKGLVKFASGLPLALRVLGSGLCTKTVEAWKAALARLVEDPDTSILKVLRVGYDGLDDSEKQIFLDIACFFNGVHHCAAKRILDSCFFYPDIGISVLIDKSLVKIQRNKICMHDLLKQMGWRTVCEENLREPGKRSRLWVNDNVSDDCEPNMLRLKDDVLDVIKNNTGTTAVESILLNLPAKEEIHLNADPFSTMSNLRLLKICNVKFSGCFENLSLSNKLRILIWHECPLESLPSSFQPDQLIEFSMHNSQIKQLWINERDCLMEKLIVMDLSDCHCLTKSPDFGKVPNLEGLSLDGCENLAELHPTIGDLQNLTCLVLSRVSLESLPHSISGLKSLRILILSGCSKLSQFPEVGNMELLSELQLDGTAITELPESIIQHLSGLRLLKLNDCKKLLGLPTVICSLTSLQYLYLSRCPLIDQLPEDIGSLEHLEELDACDTGIRKVPSSIALLKNLKFLCLQGCRDDHECSSESSTGLQLPNSFSGLSSLIRLDLRRCGLEEGGIPEDIGCLSSLKRLDLSENNFLSIPESISQLSELTELGLVSCTKLESLPKHLPLGLKSLGADDCPKLKTSNSNELTILTSDQGISLISCRKSHKDAELTRHPIPIPIPEEHAEQSFHKFIEDRIDIGLTFELRFLHTKIPEWFSRRKSGSSVTIQLPDDHTEDIDSTLMGFALFVVFEFNENKKIDNSWERTQIVCDFYTKEGRLGKPKVFQFNGFITGATYGHCFYQPQGPFAGQLHIDKERCRFIQASVSESSPDLQVKACGLHLVFSHNVKKFVQNVTKNANQHLNLNFGRHCKEILDKAMKLESSGDAIKLDNSTLEELQPTSTWSDSDIVIQQTLPRSGLPLLLSILYEGQSGREKEFYFSFPHGGLLIPPWFYHNHYAGDIALCYLPQNLFGDERWVGLELYVMFTWRPSHVPPNCNQLSLLHVDLCASETSRIRTSVVMNSSGGPHQLVVVHIPRARFPEQWNQCPGISAFFTTTAPNMEIQLCGSRLVYDQDLELLFYSLIDCTFGRPHLLKQLSLQAQLLVQAETPLERNANANIANANAVEGERPVNDDIIHSWLQRESAKSQQELLTPEQGFTSKLHKYQRYLQQKQGGAVGCDGKIIAHSKQSVFASRDHIQFQENVAQKLYFLACRRLHVVAETQLYGGRNSVKWKRDLEWMLQYSEVATLSLRGQVISVLEQFHPCSQFNFCFPQKEMLEWFKHCHCRRPKIGIQLSPKIFEDDNWRGLVICAAFSVHEHPSASITAEDMGSKMTVKLMCHLAIEEQCLNPIPMCSITKDKFKWLYARGFIWVTYIPRVLLAEFRTLASDIVIAEIYSSCPGVMVNKVGISLLFQQDEDEFKQAIIGCWTSFFDNLDPIRQFVEADDGIVPPESTRSMPQGSHMKDFDRDSIFNATSPATEMVEWFRDHSDSPSVRITLPPSLCSDENWIGVALFAYFFSSSPDQNLDLETADHLHYLLLCHLETDHELQSSLEPLIHSYQTSHEEFKRLQEHEGFVWLSYIPRKWFGADQLNDQSNHLEASFASESIGLGGTQKCGVRLVYKHDEKEFKQHCIHMASFLDDDQTTYKQCHDGEAGPKNQKGKRVLEDRADHEFDIEPSTSLLMEYNMKDFDRDSIYNATSPATEMVEWFRDHSDSPSLRITLPPSLCNDENWIGVALFAYFFSSSPDQNLDLETADHHHYLLLCHLETDHELQSSLEPRIHSYQTSHEEFKRLQEHEGFVWLSYIPRKWFGADQLNDQSTHLEASFASKSRGLGGTQKCGVRLVYKHDEEEFMQHCIHMVSFLDDDQTTYKQCHDGEAGPKDQKGKRVLEYPADDEFDIGPSTWLIDN